MKQKSILIVEDSLSQLQGYEDFANKLKFKPYTASSRDDAIKILTSQSIDILLTDIHLSPTVAIDTFEGFEVIEYATNYCPETIIIAMSNDPKVTTFHHAFKVGAMAYIKKPILSPDEIILALEAAADRADAQKLRSKSKKISMSAQMAERCEDGIVLDPTKRKLAQKLAQTKNIPLVISGETGVGKEEYVRLIHKKREEYENKTVPLVVVNCGNLDGPLASSSLFGHVRGAFTGADKTTKGAIGEADEGILFLDEIHHLTVECQKKLLRVLNDGTYERVGDSRVLKSNFQLVVASTQNLDDLVQKKLFLLDLRMRITGIEIKLESLRSRKDDMESLVILFLEKLQAKVAPVELSEVVEQCKKYYWQGNIRQLFKTIQALVTMASFYDEPIRAANLPVNPLMLDPNDETSDPIDISPEMSEDIVNQVMEPLIKDADFNHSIAKYERLILTQSFKRHRTIRDVAQALNIPRSTLDGKRQKYEIGGN